MSSHPPTEWYSMNDMTFNGRISRRMRLRRDKQKLKYGSTNVNHFGVTVRPLGAVTKVSESEAPPPEGSHIAILLRKKRLRHVQDYFVKHIVAIEMRR